MEHIVAFAYKHVPIEGNEVKGHENSSFAANDGVLKPGSAHTQYLHEGIPFGIQQRHRAGIHDNRTIAAKRKDAFGGA